MSDGMALKRLIDVAQGFNDSDDSRIPRLLARIAELEKELLLLKAIGSFEMENYSPIRAIADVVAHRTGFSVPELCSERRQKPLSACRHILMYLACKHTKLSTMRIGKFMKKDHTSVMYGRDKVKKKMESDPAFKAFVDAIEAGLNRESPE